MLIELYAKNLLEEKKEYYSFLVDEGLKNEIEDDTKLAENALTFGEELAIK